MVNSFRNLKLRLPAVALAALLLAGCAPRQESIFIISTNDIHGAIENFPHLATVVQHYRAQDTASVFLVDAGDRWTGNPYVDMAVENGVRVDGKPIIDLMNSLGYDAATFGNHEFDKGMAHLDKRTKEARFPVILANMRVDDAPITQPEPYTVLTSRGGNKVALVGLITNFINGHPDGRDETFEGTGFVSPYDAALEYAPLGERNNVLVAITHTGDDADSLLATKTEAYDLIVGGHTHRVITGDEPLIVNGTHITQTGRALRYVGITEIRMKDGEVEWIDNRLVKLDTVAPDPVYAGMVEKYYDNPILARKVGSLSADITKTGMANLLADIVRRDMDVDFALYHIGGVRVNGFPAGDVTVGDMFAVDPFSSTSVKCRMTLEQIRRLIIDKFNDTQNPKESHKEDIYPSGMTYTIITDERGEAIDVTFNHKLPYGKDRLYTVALSDYMYANYKFDRPEAEGRSKQVTDLLTEHFEKCSPVKPDNVQRITIRMR